MEVCSLEVVLAISAADADGAAARGGGGAGVRAQHGRRLLGLTEEVSRV